LANLLARGASLPLPLKIAPMAREAGVSRETAYRLLRAARRTMKEEDEDAARQRGSTVKRGSTWGARFYDEQGTRRFRGGFPTKTEAREWLDRKVTEVEALRSGEQVSPVEIPTVTALVDSYLASTR
jgi:hypothetical protein